MKKFYFLFSRVFCRDSACSVREPTAPQKKKRKLEFKRYRECVRLASGKTHLSRILTSQRVIQYVQVGAYLWNLLKRRNMKSSKWSGTVIAVLLCVLRTDGFYIPGIDQTYFKRGESINIKGGMMVNDHSLPHSFSFLPLCLPKAPTAYDNFENFGQMLRGQRMINIGYEVEMTKNVICRSVCSTIPNYQLNMSSWDSKRLGDSIRNRDFVRLQIDNLPGLSKIVEKTGHVNIEAGYPLGGLGKIEEGIFRHYINNYLEFKLYYHKHGEDEFTIVGFEIEAHSINSKQVYFNGDICRWPTNSRRQFLKEESGTVASFMYSVEWIETEVSSYENRWDYYVGRRNVRSRLQVIFYMVVVGFLLSVIITAIVTAIRGSEQSRNLDKPIDATSWKLHHGAVFRTPKNPQFFAAVIGNGIQIVYTLFATLILGILGFLSPASPGILFTCIIFLYAFSGLIAGYFVARFYKTWGGEESSEKTLAGFLFVSIYRIVFDMCFFFSVLFMVKQSSVPVPCTIMIAMLSFFIGLSTLLVYVGDYWGHRQQPFTHPVKTNEISKEVVELPWYKNVFFWILLIIAGFLLFRGIGYDLPEIVSSEWANQYYNLFGVLFIDFCILASTSSQITILMVYWQICRGEYRWWWNGFIVSGISAIFFFPGSILYYYYEVTIVELVPILIFFGYTTLILVIYWLLTGTIGFFAAYVFIRQIYATVKTNNNAEKNSAFVFSNPIVFPEKSPLIS